MLNPEQHAIVSLRCCAKMIMTVSASISLSDVGKSTAGRLTAQHTAFGTVLANIVTSGVVAPIFCADCKEG
jgi:hypothetical protein